MTLLWMEKMEKMGKREQDFMSLDFLSSEFESLGSGAKTTATYKSFLHIICKMFIVQSLFLQNIGVTAVYLFHHSDPFPS